MAFDVIPKGTFRYRWNGLEYTVTQEQLRRLDPREVKPQSFPDYTAIYLFQFAAKLACGNNAEWNVYVEAGLEWPYTYRCDGVQAHGEALTIIEDLAFDCIRD